MKFEKLTHKQLKILKSQGFNILTSNNLLTDEKVVWFPEKVDNVEKFLMEVASEEPTLLFINEALENIPDENLIGEVFI